MRPEDLILEIDGRAISGVGDLQELMVADLIGHPGRLRASRAEAHVDMVICMRMTINLPDALGRDAKARAHAEGRTFTSLVDGLRMVLASGDERRGEPVAPLPAFGDPDEAFLVDPSDPEALRRALDADGPR